MPSATFTHQSIAHADKGAVWGTLQEATTWADIGPVEDVRDAIHTADGHLASFQWSTTVAARRYPGTAVVTAAEPEHRMLLELDAREVAGTLETKLDANGDGTTEVTVTLRVTSRGTLSTLFFPVVSEAIAKGLPAQVERFAASLGGER